MRGKLKAFLKSGTVIVESGDDGQEFLIQSVDEVAVLIGSRPSLNYLPAATRADLLLPEAVRGASGKGITANVCDVDPYTFEATRVPDLYAIGSLAVENFARFVVGSAFGCAAGIVRELRAAPATPNGTASAASPATTAEDARATKPCT